MSDWSVTRYGLTLVTAPTLEPLTYDQAKAWLRLPDNTDQTFVEALIVSARQRVEQDTGLVLLSQTWDLTLDTFPDDGIEVPVAPVLAVTSITTTSVAGAATTVDASNYQVDLSRPHARIVLSDAGAWPTDIRRTAGIVVRLSCGFGASAASVPGPLLRAMEQLIAHLYLHRSSTVAVPLAPPFQYWTLIQPYRRVGLA